MKEKITIIVPVYNVEDYLARCVDSILAQTYQNLQIILVDDGSTDASGEICDAFAQKDQRVQVIHKDNGGPTLARKTALVKAVGEYVAFVDGDDYIEPNMYEELLEYLLRTGSDFVQSGYIEESEAWGNTVYLPEEEKTFSNFDKCEIISKYLLGNEELGIATDALWTKLYKRQLIMKCYGKVPDELVFGEDLLNLCHCIFNSTTFSMKKSAYYHYAYRVNSLSCRNGDTIIFSRIGDYHRYLRAAFKEYGYFEQLREKQDEYLIRFIALYLLPMGNARGIFYTPYYCYPKVDELKGKRIVIYGAGFVGKDYYAQICRYSSCTIVALADTYPEKYDLGYTTVKGLSDLSVLEFDVVVIAVLYRSLMLEIREMLIDAGIPEHKLAWEKPEALIENSRTLL